MQKNIADSYLGQLQYSEEEELYQGNFFLEENQTIEFSFDVDDNLEEMLQVTRNVVEKIKNSDRNYRLHIAKHLLDSYNDDWSEAKVIDREEFANRISLDSVTIYDENSAEIYYQDADLFTGNYIVVHFSLTEELGEPYLAG